MFALLTIPRGSWRDEAGDEEAEPVFGIVIRPPRVEPRAPLPHRFPARALRPAGTTP